MESVISKDKDTNKEPRINEKITAPRVQLIDTNAKPIGVVAIYKALQLAEEREIDLVEVAPDADPPVCKLMDYGKLKYHRKKSEKERKKNSQQEVTKELWLRPRTDDHDLEIKMAQAKKFLEKNSKVVITIKFKGRELRGGGMIVGQAMIEKVKEHLKEHADSFEVSGMEGRRIKMAIKPISSNKKK